MDPLNLNLVFALGASIGVSIVALAYLAGRYFQSQRLSAFSKIELQEVVTTAIIIAIIIPLLSGAKTGIIHTMMPPMLDGSGGFLDPSTREVSVNGVQRQIYNEMEQPLAKTIEALAKSNMRLSKLVSYNFNYRLGGYGYAAYTSSASPGSGASVLSSAMYMAIDSTSINMFLSSAIKIIYVFLDHITYLILMPLGILLRFIAPTRKLGSTLIAISIGILLVFPLSVFWSTTLLDVGPGGYDSTKIIESQSNPPGADIVCSDVVGALAKAGEEPIGNLVGALICSLFPPTFPACFGHINPAPIPIPDATSGVSGWTQFAVWVTKTIFLGVESVLLESHAPDSAEVVDEAYGPMRDYLLPLTVGRNMSILLMVLIQLTSTIVITKGIAQVLGAEGRIYGLSRMV